MDVLRPFNIPPGDYLMPRAASGKEMRSAEYLEKIDKGPIMMLTVLPTGPWNIGKQLSLWFVYVLLVSVFSAYVAGRALVPGADYVQVFRFAGTAAFLSYVVGLWQMSIWYQRSWSLTLKATLDGLIYSLLIGGTFGALWPR
jgi:hypothetical protein